MRQIKYNDASNVIRFEYPVDWPGEDITGLTLAITDNNGDTLLSAQSATLYTATSLQSAATRFSDDEITLATGAGDLNPGDLILLEGDLGFETARVAGYDSGTKIAKLEQYLSNTHEAGDTVRGLWATYTLDTTTVATWPSGTVCTLLWTPAGGGHPTTELAQIADTVVDVEGLERRFSRLFPRAYDVFKEPADRFADMLTEAEHEVRQELLAEQLDINRVIDQNTVSSLIMYKLATFWTLQGDETLNDEHQKLMSLYEAKKSIVLTLPVWQDHDQDLVEDDGETTSHDHLFMRGW